MKPKTMLNIGLLAFALTMASITVGNTEEQCACFSTDPGCDYSSGGGFVNCAFSDTNQIYKVVQSGGKKPGTGSCGRFANGSACGGSTPGDDC